MNAWKKEFLAHVRIDTEKTDAQFLKMYEAYLQFKEAAREFYLTVEVDAAPNIIIKK